MDKIARVVDSVASWTVMLLAIAALVKFLVFY